MNRLALFGLFASAPAAAGIDAGDHLFLYAEVVDCPRGQEHVVDYARVSADGHAEFYRLGIELLARGLDAKAITEHIARRISDRVGHAPKTLRLEVVPHRDRNQIIKTLGELVRPLRCRDPHPRDRDRPPEDLRYLESLNRRLAGLPAPHCARV